MGNQIYLIGSLRNPEIPRIGNILREKGLTIFDDWHAAGPEADDYWQKYEKGRGRSYPQALQGAAAKNVYRFDKRHLDESAAAILIMPAGKSGHLELGYMAGQGKLCYILFDEEPERFDVMPNFVYDTGGAVLFSIDELLKHEGMQRLRNSTN